MSTTESDSFIAIILTTYYFILYRNQGVYICV